MEAKGWLVLKFEFYNIFGKYLAKYEYVIIITKLVYFRLI